MSPGAVARPNSVFAIAGDALVLSIILQWVDRDEATDWHNLNVSAAWILAIEAAFAWLFAEPFGLWAAMPMFAAAAAILKARCNLSWTKALFTAHVLLAVQLGVWTSILRASGILR